MRTRSLFLCQAAVLVICSRAGLGAPAATEGAAGPTASPDPAPAAYRFVPGDVLEISVEPRPEYGRTLTIQPDGRIAFPVVGELTAAGMTAQQLSEQLEQGLQRELKRPRVTVSLKEINKGILRRVSVLGCVLKPGVFELKEQATVTEMLASAGGPAPAADLRRVTVTHPGGEVVVVDLSQSTRTGQVSRNLLLQAGDLVMVPSGALPSAQILGAVTRPGSYELQGETRLLDVLSQAGGPSPKADLHRVTLTRPGQPKEQVLDLWALLTSGQPGDKDGNVLLQPGDTLILPEIATHYYVLGEVNKADAYPLRPTDRLLDAIATASGSTRDADLSKVMLIRKNATGEAIAERVDLKQMMKSGKMAANRPLQDGDVIFIPNRRPRRSFTDYLSVLYPLTGLINVLR